ncbi:MAG: hypothetical protein IJS28_02710 [Synergistaceae bacterium]|nr:hypothetical protein [Synergistaceae bacterium]
MPLNDYAPLSDDDRPLIVSAEKGRRHIGCNVGRDRVTHYRVDGVILCGERACDYIVINEKKKTAYLIELKGCRIDKAAEQLKATAEILGQYLRGYELRFRIVASKSRTSNTPLNSARRIIDKWEASGRFRMSTNEMKEDI